MRQPIIYDNGGETFDCYTAFVGKIEKGIYLFIGMSERPFHPQGFGQHGEWKVSQCGFPSQATHIGKRISIKDLPEDCRKLVLSEMEAQA